MRDQLIKLSDVPPGALVNLYRPQRKTHGPTYMGAVQRIVPRCVGLRWTSRDLDTQHHAMAVVMITKAPRCIQGCDLQVQEHYVTEAGTHGTTVCTPWGEMVHLDSSMLIVALGEV